MNPFEEVNRLLDRMEQQINNEEFDIDKEECNALNNSIINEFKQLEHSWADKSEFNTAKERFEKLWNVYEPIEEDERSVRDMMFPEGEDED
jgi:hypothetical protein